MTAVDYRVAQERGQWVVYLVRLDGDGVHEQRLSTWRTRHQAQVFADASRRGAYRRRTEPGGTPPAGREQAPEPGDAPHVDGPPGLGPDPEGGHR